MTRFIYKILDREAYLTGVKYGGDSTFEVKIEDGGEAMLNVGNITAKLVDGVGRVKLNDVPYATLTPEVIFKDKSVLLYPIRLCCGKITLAHPEEICAALATHLLNDRERIVRIEGELLKLNDAICGKAIF